MNALSAEDIVSRRPAAAESRLSSYIQRQLVLSYLCHHCYVGTARAFVKESSVQLLDADGDEIMLRDKAEPIEDVENVQLRSGTPRSPQHESYPEPLTPPRYSTMHHGWPDIGSDRPTQQAFPCRPSTPFKTIPGK